MTSAALVVVVVMKIPVLGESRCGAVVENDPVLAQHDAVAGLADRQGFPAIDIDAIQELDGVRALDIDLAQCRDIDPARRHCGVATTSRATARSMLSRLSASPGRR